MARGLQLVDASRLPPDHLLACSGPPKHVASSRAGQPVVFVESPPPTLVCQLCHDVLLAPLLLPCGHAFCAACCATPTATGNGSCPLAACSDCRRPSAGLLPQGGRTQPDGAVHDVMRSQRAAALPVFCENAVVTLPDGRLAFDPSGCFETHPLGRRLVHEAQCLLARVPCGLVDDTLPAAPAACPAILRAGEALAHRAACLFRSARCGRCGERLVVRRAAQHDARCGVLPCPAGCGKLVRLTQLAQHTGQCSETQVACAMPDVRVQSDVGPDGLASGVTFSCNAVMKRSALAAHAAVCELRLASCPHCGEVASQRRLAVHTVCCPLEVLQCPSMCGQLVPRRLLRQHALESCPVSTVSCELAAIGCSKRMLRADMQRHDTEAAPEHTHLLAHQLERLQAQQAETADCVAALRNELTASRALTAAAIASGAAELAAVRDAASTEMAALRREVDELRVLLSHKSDQSDIHAMKNQFTATASMALDASVAATVAAAPNAAAHERTLAAAVAAAEKAVRKGMATAAHADDLDSLGALVHRNAAATASELRQMRADELRILHEAQLAAAADSESRVRGLAGEVHGLRVALRHAMLDHASAATQAVFAAVDTEPPPTESRPARRRSKPPLPASGEDVSEWRTRVLRNAGYEVRSAPRRSESGRKWK